MAYSSLLEIISLKNIVVSYIADNIITGINSPRIFRESLKLSEQKLIDICLD